jgi:hypothetical protein
VNDHYERYIWELVRIRGATPSASELPTANTSTLMNVCGVRGTIEGGTRRHRDAGDPSTGCFRDPTARVGNALTKEAPESGDGVVTK